MDGFDGFEESLVLGMVSSGVHPYAVKNTVLARRERRGPGEKPAQTGARVERVPDSNTPQALAGLLGNTTTDEPQTPPLVRASGTWGISGVFEEWSINQNGDTAA